MTRKWDWPETVARAAGCLTMAEVWQETMQLRFRGGMLEQAWRSPDGRIDWRRVPVVVDSPAAPIEG